MRVTVLGSGNAIPQPGRASAGYLVEAEAPVVMDLGAGALQNLARTGTAPEAVAAVVISHLHADHVADLLPFLHAQARLKQGRPPLTIVGPPGLAETVAHLRAATPSTRELPFEVRVREVRAEPVELCGALWRPAEVIHSPSLTALAWRVERGGRVLVYSGDSTDCPALEEACRGAHLAILDATFPPGVPHPSHMNGGQAAALASRARVGRAVLSHLDASWAGVAAPAELARDLLSTDV